MKNYGKAVIFSTSGSVLSFGSVTGGDKIIQSENMTNNNDNLPIMGQDNEIIGFIVTKERKELTIEYMPAGYTFEQHEIVLRKILGCSIYP